MIDRDIILDLLPLYRAGLGSPATRAAVEAWLAEHPEHAADAMRDPSEEAAMLAALARARAIARRRRWLFAAAVALTALALALKLDFAGGVPHVTLLMFESPLLLAPVAAAALLAWGGYWWITRRGA